MGGETKKRKSNSTKSNELKKSKIASNGMKLQKDFFRVPANVLAEKLLGKLLVRRLDKNELLKGRIVETECYPGGGDKGSITYNNRRTPATEPLYMPPGTAFVYMTYGMYHCINISSDEDGGGVLIRALEPIAGVERMKQFRSAKRKSEIPDHDLCGGPSKLCTSFKIEKATCNKLDFVTSDSMWLENDGGDVNVQVVKTNRVGINSAGKEAVEKPYRFYILGNKNVSKFDKVKEQELLEVV